MDYEIDYANNLMNYINKRGKFALQISAFSSTEYLINYMKRTEIDILLVSEDVEIDMDFLKQKVKNIYLLTEGQTLREEAEYPSIYKFQPAEQVMSEIIELYAEGNQEKSRLKLNASVKGSEIIGVFSPAGGSYKSTFALSIANYYGENQKVLYLNFDLFADLSWLSLKAEGRGLTDLLYYCKQKNANLAIKLGSMIQKVSFMDYILPVRHYLDLIEMEQEDMLYLIRSLRCDTDYEMIIIDVGFFHESTLQGLKECNKIYMTLGRDFCSESKIKTFYSQMKEAGEQTFTNKIKEVVLPYDEVVEMEPGNFGRWLCGPIGEYLKRIQMEES